VRSQQDVGSTFYFDALFAASSQEESPQSELLTGLAGRRVLIIDDNKTNRLIFSEMCRSWGMETTECQSSSEVLPLLQSARQLERAIDLLILDRMMDQDDGLKLVATIRETYRQLPILMITSDNVPGDQTKVLQYGVTEYAVKPIRRSELLRLMNKLLASKEGAKRDSTIEPEVKAADERKLRLLIAEDSDDNRFLLEEYLKAEPYEITFAENGALAVDKALSQPFDLILMDVQMPVMDGLSAARLIRESEKRTGRNPVPLLALTANAHGEDVGLSKAAGCNAHVSKPISKQDLLNTVRKFTRRNAAHKDEAEDLAISIPSGLEQAAIRYIRSRKNEVGRLQELARAEDFEAVRSLAHNIKGTGTSYGFPNLTRLGRLIEVASIEGDAGALGEQLLELARYVEEAEVLVQKTCAVQPG
jgi:CheY-like chemotaxis protein